MINVFDVFVKIAIVSQLLGEAALHTAAFFLGGGGWGRGACKAERRKKRKMSRENFNNYEILFPLTRLLLL